MTLSSFIFRGRERRGGEDMHALGSSLYREFWLPCVVALSWVVQKKYMIKFLCIVAKTKSTKASIFTAIVATTTVSPVEGRVYTFAIAAYVIVFAFLPAGSTVKAISQNIYTLLLAAVRPWTSPGMANPRKLVTCHSTSFSSPLSKNATKFMF